MTGGLDCIVKAVTQLEEKLRTDKNGKKVASSTAPTASSSGEARLVSAEQPPQVSAFIALSKQRGAQDIAALTQRGAMGMEETEVALNARVKQIILHDLALYELKTIPVPGPNEAIPCVTHMDVLSGRGGETNHHPGNILYRQFVRACQPEYIEAKRREKPYIAQRIVLAVRKMGGRFLKKDHSNIWRDVGNTKAREKTSQALREGAPELRADGTKMPFTSRLVPMNLNTEVLRKRLVGQEVSAGSADDEASADKGKEGSSKDQTSSPPPNKKARTDTASQLATISADDCEGDKHAPRIKLLKKRLAGDESN